MIIQEYTNEKGLLHVDTPLAKQDWLDVITSSDTPQHYIETLLLFYYEKEHKATCALIGEKYGRHSSSVMSDIKNFGGYVQRKFVFTVKGIDGNASYWGTIMDGKKTKEGFLWIVKRELSDAILEYLYRKMFQAYKDLRKEHPINDSNQDEKYKWSYITLFEKNKSLIDIADYIKSTNLVYTTYANSWIAWLISNRKSEFSMALENLTNEEKPLVERIKVYTKAMKAINSDDYAAKSYFAHDERTASAILTCYNPNAYTFYMNDVYQSLCAYLSVPSKKVGEKYAHYLDLLKPLVTLIENDTDLQSLIAKQTPNCLQSSLLSAQDVCWELFRVHTDILNLPPKEVDKPNYWFVGYCWGQSNSKLEEFKVSSVWQGNFGEESNAEQLQLAKKIKTGDFLVFKASSTKGKNHDVPFLRVPCIGIVKDSPKIENVEFDNNGEPTIRVTVPLVFLTLEAVDFDGNKYGKYRNTIHKCEEQEIIDYIKNINDMKVFSPHQKYVDLLKANHNIIFNGAPGTGKTYLARQIALAMNSDDAPGFVQFHPSYDYSDFIEGLRPVRDEKGNIGFERKDGVFKSFCKKAQQNLVDAKKSVADIQEEMDINDRLDNFVTNAIENDVEMKTTSTKNKFFITDQNEKSIYISAPNNKNIKDVVVPKSDIISLFLAKKEVTQVCDIKKFFGRNYGTQADSYTCVIYNMIKSEKNVVAKNIVRAVTKKNYVFIIDEINRGEISKIFGELFYSIDPGYRGEKGKVQTQYQNLVEEGDIFKDGFYVPENVYIIGTMNDIDRSVESMDFAMRRRFAWQEITAEESAQNMGIEGELLERMERLNGVILETEGLGSSYQVGAAMFLKVKDGDMTEEQLWNLNLKSLMKEYLRGLPQADETLDKMEKAYFLEDDNNDNTRQQI